jgi:hypothetical protein
MGYCTAIQRVCLHAALQTLSKKRAYYVSPFEERIFSNTFKKRVSASQQTLITHYKQQSVNHV